MSLVIPIDYVSVGLEFVHAQDPEPWIVTFGLDLRNATEENKVTLLQATAVLWGGTILPFQDSQVNLIGVNGRFGQDGDPLTVNAPHGQMGTGTGDKLPQNCALHVRKFTPLGGRRGKGRMFVPGILSKNEVSEVGVIGNNEVAAYGDAFTGFLEDLASEDNINGPTPMVLLHNSEGSQPVPAPTEVTNLAVDSLISTQRRRLR